MRFLICLRGEKLSRPTLHFAALMASRLSTDISVLFVGPGVRRSFSTEADMLIEKMNEWAIDSPGLEVIRSARDHLQSMGLIGDDALSGSLAPGHSGALELSVPGKVGEDVTFRYRQGDALVEILDELQAHRYDLLVIGAGTGYSSLVEKLLQFSSSSVLVVKNPLDIRYRVLVATDASPSAHRAELLALKTASFLKLELTYLTVVRKEKERHFMERHLKRMQQLCELKRVPHKVIIASGGVVDETIAAAGEDHIIFLGQSRRGTLRKLLLGSKTIRIVNGARSPILVVK